MTKIFSKIAFILLLGVVSLGASAFVVDQMFSKQGGIGHVSSMLAALKLRTTHPTMSAQRIAEESAKANQGAIGLVKTLSQGAIGDGAPVGGFAALHKAHDPEPPRDPREIVLSSTDETKEVVGIVHHIGTEDLTAIDRINALNISDDLRNQILKNYYATGVLPEILTRQKRRPTTQSIDDEIQ